MLHHWWCGGESNVKQTPRLRVAGHGHVCSACSADVVDFAMPGESFTIDDPGRASAAFI